MNLPRGFTAVVADGLLTTSPGDTVVGGSPLTAIRLSPRAKRLMDQGRLTVTDDSSAHLVRRLLATNLAYPDLTQAAPVSAQALTVVIPVRDRPDQLTSALAQLTGAHCIVVDDASHDRAAVAQVCARFDATYLPLDHNVGPAAARNVGLGHVRTRYVAFVDSNVQVTTDALLTLARHFTDPHVALVGPMVVGRPTSSRPRWFERYDAYASSLTLGSTPSNVRPGAAVAWLPSACLVARRDALGDGFDPTMRVGEDVDLVWRLVSSGHGARYEPSIVAQHDTRRTVRGWLGRKFVYGTGGARLAARHGDAIAPSILTPTQAAAGAALLMRQRWSPLAAVATIAWSAARVRSSYLEEPTGQSSLLASLHAGWAGPSVRSQHSPFVTGARGLRCSLRLSSSSPGFGQHPPGRQHGRPGRGRKPPGEDQPLLLLLGRRLDDLAYGAGLWWGPCVNAL